MFVHLNVSNEIFSNEDFIMGKVDQFISLVNDAYAIANDHFNEETRKKADQERQALVGSLERNSFVKVPFIGEYSAGKSSLICGFLGKPGLLPTALGPETAVAYEIYYGTDEHIEIFQGEKLIGKKPLSEISNTDLPPDYLVKVFADSPVLKDLCERRVVIVDMPGLNSGIAAHNNAILRYVEDGTHFVVVVDAEGGTVNKSTISFINDEAKKYGAGVTINISKSDHKPADELAKIKATIEDSIKRRVGDDVKVVTSSVLKKDYKGIMGILDSLNAEELVEKRFRPSVEGLIKGYINILQSQINALQQDQEKNEQQLQELREEQERAVEELQEMTQDAESTGEAVEDILGDVESALLDREESFVSMIYRSPNNTKGVENQIMSTVRPIVVTGLKEKMGDYSKVISGALKNFSINISEVFSIAGASDEKVGPLVSGLQTVATPMLTKFLSKVMPVSLGPVLGPIVSVLMSLLPSFIGKLFGQNEEDKKEEIRESFETEIVPDVLDSLRGTIEEVISVQRAEMDKKAQETIDAETAKYTSVIEEAMKQKDDCDQKIAILQSTSDKLSGLLS